MLKYNKENDSQLYEYFGNLKKAIEEYKALDFYSAACDILKHVIEVSSANAGLKTKKGFWFFKKAFTLEDYLASPEVRKYLNVIGVDVYACNKIKDNSAKASKKGNIEFNIDEILVNSEFIIDLVLKIYEDMYGTTAPKRDDFKFIIDLLEKNRKKIIQKQEPSNETKEIVENKNDVKVVVSAVKKENKKPKKKIDDGFISAEDQLDATPRLPICICLDFSGSMRGAKYDKMKEGLQMFCNAILEDAKACRSAEISIIAFNEEVNVLRKFSRLDSPINLSGMEPRYGTKISPAIEYALDMLEQRKAKYRELGMEYYQPWLVIISDGLPADNCEEVQARVLELEANKKVVVLSLPILSPNNDKEKNQRTMAFMDGFSANKSIPLDSEKIKEFFVWLSRSIHVSVRKGKADFTSTTNDFKARL